jgi:hypothetical protein
MVDWPRTGEGFPHALSACAAKDEATATATAAASERGVVDLVCVATAPGLVEKQQTARDLRHAIAQVFDGCPRKQNAIRHLEVVPSTEAEFQAARAALADKVCDESVFRLKVHCGVAAMGAARNCRLSLPLVP